MPDAVDKSSEQSLPKKSSSLIYLQELEEGIDALDLGTPRLFISGLAAGLELALSLLLISIVLSLGEGVLSRPALALLVATMSSFGFIAVILGRSELFTEQTTLAILPLLTGNTTLKEVARLWTVVYVANLLGAAICAAIIVTIAPALRETSETVFGDIAKRIVDHPGWVILMSGVLAGWLMGLLSWLVAAGRDTISQIVVIWIFTSAIGLCHLHHSILGAAEVLGGVFSGSAVTLGDFTRFLAWATAGNALGGAGFVALLKFGHARPGRNA